MAIPERARVDHVARAARVHHHARPRQRGGQRADAAGVVQVHVGRDDAVDGVAREAQRVQRRQQARHREVRAGVDEGGAAVREQQVGGVEVVALEAGVDGEDVVAERRHEGGQGVVHGAIVGAALRRGTGPRKLVYF